MQNVHGQHSSRHCTRKLQSAQRSRKKIVEHTMSIGREEDSSGNPGRPFHPHRARLNPTRTQHIFTSTSRIAAEFLTTSLHSHSSESSELRFKTSVLSPNLGFNILETRHHTRIRVLRAADTRRTIKVKFNWKCLVSSQRILLTRQRFSTFPSTLDLSTTYSNNFENPPIRCQNPSFIRNGI